MGELLQINGFTYQGFDNFNLYIENYQYISIIGSNMCGKTTLFKVISGIIPTNNVVICNDIYLNRENVNNYIKLLGVVFPYTKNAFLFETVEEELSYPLTNLGYCKSYIKRRIKNVLKLFELDILNKNISELNILEKQKLLFCISLLHKPKILLIDDVFINMNIKEAEGIIQKLKSINDLSIINFSSNMNNLDYSDYIYVLNDGKILLEGVYNDILKEVSLLSKIGLEIPFMLNLSNKLQEQGIIKKNYSNLEDLVNDIWK